jgi:transcriptional regulator with XRE-family HTH domain
MARFLIDARKNLGLRQSDLAGRLRKPQSFVSKYESLERRLDILEFIRICEALDLNPAAVVSDLQKNLGRISPRKG